MRHHALLLLALAIVPSVALAQSDDDKNTARALAQDGQEALDKKDFPTAADRFHRAVSIFDDAKAPVPPTLLLGLARADAGVGHLIASNEAYNRLIRQGTPPGAPALFTQAVEDGKKEIDGVASRIASVTITVTGCDKPQVTVDSAPMSAAALGVKKPIDPGKHVVKASAQGCKPGEAAFTAEEGKPAQASIVLVVDKDAAATPNTGTPPDTTPPPTGPATGTPPPGGDQGPAKGGGPWTALAVTGFVIGGVGLALGAITGAIALGDNSTLKNECANGTCPASAQSDLDGYHTMGAVSTAGFIIGGVGLAAGIIFLVAAPKSSSQKTGSAWIMPSIGPTSVGAIGRF